MWVGFLLICLPATNVYKCLQMSTNVAGKVESLELKVNILIISLRYSQSQYESIEVKRRGSIAIEYK
jgi:hypothetical protein